MEKIVRWVGEMRRLGLVCDETWGRFSRCENLGEYYRVFSDVDSLGWVCEMMMRGVEVPVEEFREVFGSYIDGGRDAVYDAGYTSSIYVRSDRDIEVRTTLLLCVECCCGVRVLKNKFPRLILSPRSDVEIVVEDGARLLIEAYGDARYSVSGDLGRVKVERHQRGRR